MAALDVLGAIFSTGSQFSRQNRLDKQDEEERRLKMERERQLIDLALRGEQRQVAQDQRSVADRLLANIGPLGQVDETAAGDIRAGGLGSRLKEQEGTLSSTKFLPGAGGDPRMSESPGLQAGTVVMPNRMEQMSLDAADQQQQARQFELDEDAQAARLRSYIEQNPDSLFAKGPVEAARLWAMSGLPGQPPQDPAEWDRRTAIDQTNRMAQIGATTAGNIQIANQRIQAGLDRPMTTGQEFNATRSLRNDFVRETKAAQEMIRQATQMESGMAAARNGDLAQGSQAVLVTFQKLLDPTSVVRESEYARSAAGQSIVNQAQGIVDRLSQGGAGVPLPELEKFANLAKVFADNQVKMAGHTSNQIDAFARRYGLDPSLITRELAPEEGGSPLPGAGGDVAVERDPVTGKLRVKQ